MWGKPKTDSKKAEFTIAISDEDLEVLSEHYKACDVRDARDNLFRAMWGCGCCELSWDLSKEFLRITDGIRYTITDFAIQQIEDYRRR